MGTCLASSSLLYSVPPPPRYAVKLLYDEGSLGEAESWEELAEYLEDYDQNWCIVRESEEEWSAAVLANTPHLFSLGQDSDAQVSTGAASSKRKIDSVGHYGSL